ncbi:6841_t:CDS:2, partial [Funneliformis geosporum]
KKIYNKNTYRNGKIFCVCESHYTAEIVYNILSTVFENSGYTIHLSDMTIQSNINFNSNRQNLADVLIFQFEKEWLITEVIGSPLKIDN